MGTLGEPRVPLRPLTLKVCHCPLLVSQVGEGVVAAPSGGTATSLGAARDGVTDGTPVRLGGPSTVEADPLPMDPLPPQEGGQAGATIPEPPTSLLSEEVGSTSVAMLAAFRAASWEPTRTE